MMRNQGMAFVLLGMILFLGYGVSQAADFPGKPITLVVPVGKPADSAKSR